MNALPWNANAALAAQMSAQANSARNAWRNQLGNSPTILAWDPIINAYRTEDGRTITPRYEHDVERLADDFFIENKREVLAIEDKEFPKIVSPKFRQIRLTKDVSPTDAVKPLTMFKSRDGWAFFDTDPCLRDVWDHLRKKIRERPVLVFVDPWAWDLNPPWWKSQGMCLLRREWCGPTPTVRDNGFFPKLGITPVSTEDEPVFWRTEIPLRRGIDDWSEENYMPTEEMLSLVRRGV